MSDITDKKALNDINYVYSQLFPDYYIGAEWRSQTDDTDKKSFSCNFLIAVIFVVSFLTGIFGRGLGDKIGVLEIEGVITDGKDTMEDIVKFKEDDGIKGVIVQNQLSQEVR